MTYQDIEGLSGNWTMSFIKYTVRTFPSGKVRVELKGSKSTIRSYLTRNFFLRPEKFRCLVANPKSPVS